MERAGYRWLHDGRGRQASALPRRDRKTADRLAACPRLRRHRSDHRAAALPPRGRSRRPDRRREAEKVRTRLLAEVDERRNPRTSATVEPAARPLPRRARDRGHDASRLREQPQHIRPLLGEAVDRRIDGETLDPSTPSCGGAAPGATGGRGSTTGPRPSTVRRRCRRMSAGRSGRRRAPDPHPPQRGVRPRRSLALARHQPRAAGRAADAAPPNPTHQLPTGRAHRRGGLASIPTGECWSGSA